MKYITSTLLMISLAVACVPASAAERYATFQIIEPLPDGHVAWQFSYKDAEDKGRELNLKPGQWSSPIRVVDAIPRILVGACHDDECSGMKVVGEIPPMPLTEPDGELLISNLLMADRAVKFEIKMRWGPPGESPT